MEHMTAAQQDELTKLVGLLTAEELIEFVGDTLEDRGIPYVVWDVRDFGAEIRANWQEIPEEHRLTVAQNAFLSAAPFLADTRNNEVITEHIDGAWNDLQLTLQKEQVYQFKVRFRDPAIKSSIEAQYVTATDAGKALDSILSSFPRYKGWNVASIRIVK